MEKRLKIGQYDKAVNGKRAVLKSEISFYNGINKHGSTKHLFPVGTIVIAKHEVYGTGLTTFIFEKNGKKYEHVVREGKFDYLD